MLDTTQGGKTLPRLVRKNLLDKLSNGCPRVVYVHNPSKMVTPGCTTGKGAYSVIHSRFVAEGGELQ